VLLLPALFAAVCCSKRVPHTSYRSGGSCPDGDFLQCVAPHYRCCMCCCCCLRCFVASGCRAFHTAAAAVALPVSSPCSSLTTAAACAAASAACTVCCLDVQQAAATYITLPCCPSPPLLLCCCCLLTTVVCSKRLPRISYGSGGSGPGSDSVSEWVADPSELLSSGAAGASATKRQAFLDGEAAMYWCGLQCSSVRPSCMPGTSK
jgi:hypothetical protein